MQAGTLDLVYVAPERLLGECFLTRLDTCRIALFAIDEAHCVSKWGHDFRPEYLQLAVLHKRFHLVPRTALTATADSITRREIQEHLELTGSYSFVTGLDRPNISYRIVPKTKPCYQLLTFLQAEHPGQTGIIYCLSRVRVEKTVAWLQARGITILPYHAGLDKHDREVNQDRFLKENDVVMVATIAFGMGIDKPDVRFVAHLDPPKSLEAYYQETGRAGRDGLPSDAWMSYGLKDAILLRQMIDSSEVPEERKRVERWKLDALLRYCETTRCRRQVLLDYFDAPLAKPCGNCDTCLEPVEGFDGTEAAQKVLSAVYRTGETFSVAHVINVLRGNVSERIRHFHHDRLSVYGIGTELGRAEWHAVFRQLVAMNLLTVDMMGHGGLHLGANCRPVLRGEQRITLRRNMGRRRASLEGKQTASAEGCAREDTSMS